MTTICNWSNRKTNRETENGYPKICFSDMTIHLGRQVYGNVRKQIQGIVAGRTWTWLRMGKLKRETRSSQMTAEKMS